MINLSFAKTHLSITDFPDVSLPDFTIITGPNGAGKTHLLQALHSGATLTDIAPNQGPNNQGQIRLFDWSTMVPQDTGLFASENIRNERQNLYQNFIGLREQQGWQEPARGVARRISGITQQFVQQPWRLLLLAEEELADILPSGSDNPLFSELLEAINTLEKQVIQHLDQNSQAQLRAVAASENKPFIALTERDILSPAVPTWGQIDLFQQSFARLFVAYRDLMLANTIAQYRASKGGVFSYLTDEEFALKHGPAPWDFVNESLRNAGLDFKINNPELNDYSPFQPVLTKISSNVNVPFSALSSGEKVLMSFAFCVYYSNDRRQLSIQPKLLLLDEIDAPLHPSMSKNVIDTITKTLIASFGIKVIATTHSPSTIALAPNESIYTMSPGTPGLLKSEKSQALNILTIGVPTISISFDGRRQVFVESPRDAKIYDSVYKLLKTGLNSERSLEFVATGTRNGAKQESNTGCAVVKRLVSELTKAGNMSVFGLLDWDGVHTPDERIAVLAHNSRNGLENVFLDPLAIGLAICRTVPQIKNEIGITSEMSYIKLTSAPKDVLQNMVNAITTKVLKSSPCSFSSSQYVGGLELLVDSRFFNIDDHELEEQVQLAFPQLHSISKGREGKLIEHIIEHVFVDCPQFIPMEAKLVIKDLLERPGHS